VLACWYPFFGKLHSLKVAFVASTLWVARRRLYSQSVLPHGNGLLGHFHQGYLACAFYQG